MWTVVHTDTIFKICLSTPWQSPASFNRNSFIRKPFQRSIERQCRNVLSSYCLSEKQAWKWLLAVDQQRGVSLRCAVSVQRGAAGERASWVNWTTRLPGFPSVAVCSLPTSYLWPPLYTKHTKDSAVISQSYTSQDACCSNFAILGIDWILIDCTNSVS